MRGCVDVLRGKFYPRSRITGKFAHIVIIACQDVFVFHFGFEESKAINVSLGKNQEPRLKKTNNVKKKKKKKTSASAGRLRFVVQITRCCFQTILVERYRGESNENNCLGS